MARTSACCSESGAPVPDIASGASNDVDSNGISDECKTDCNGNGVSDSCDIASGAIDKDANGQPDDCQYAYGDFNLSGDIGGGDLAVLLSRWGPVQ